MMSGDMSPEQWGYSFCDLIGSGRDENGVSTERIDVSWTIDSTIVILGSFPFQS